MYEDEAEHLVAGTKRWPGEQDVVRVQNDWDSA